MKKINSVNFIKGIILLFLVGAGASCQKLQEEPKGLLSPDKFYSNPAQCQTVFTGSMDALFGAYRGYGNGGINNWADGQIGGQGLNYGASFSPNLWNIHYKAITNINALLKAIKGGSLKDYSPAVIAGVVAQARFLRAFNYFTLVRCYGKIPLLTEDTPDLIVTPLTPASRVEIPVMYDAIQADLLYAETNLPDYDGSTPARPNKWTAKGLLSKVYLTRATAPVNDASYFAKARDKADDVILNSPYQLLPDFKDVFKTTNKNNKEILFAYQAAGDDPNSETAYYLGGSTDGYDNFPVTLEFEASYPEQPRKHNYIQLDWSLDPNDPTAQVVNFTQTAELVPNVGKFNIPNITLDEYNSNSLGGMPILRFADILLIYAEAANQANGGPTTLAVSRINAIIKRANAGSGTEAIATIGMSKDAFDKKVIDERSFELCFENDRYFDALRKKILKEVNEPFTSVDFVPTDYLFPIPVLDATFIGNNPGY